MCKSPKNTVFRWAVRQGRQGRREQLIAKAFLTKIKSVHRARKKNMKI
jgi:hypothetical protein